MRFMQSADRLFEIVLTIIGIQAPGHLPFPRFFDHQPVKEARKKKLPNNGLNRDKPLRFTAKGIAAAVWTPCLADKTYADALTPGKQAKLEISAYGYRWFWTNSSALR